MKFNMNPSKKKGLGMAATDWGTKPKTANPRPGSESRMPYTPGTGQTQTMPYTPGTGSTQTMPYRPKPKMKPMSYDNEPMDMGWDSETPPGYATMEYKPERDGSADAPIPAYEGEGVGEQPMEDNREFDALWDQALAEVPEDDAEIPAFKEKWIGIFVDAGMDQQQAEAWVEQLFTDGL